ncbi:hypothetical protein [Streptomyces xanthochromogenes]|uniref:Uncharacterized protein n=1 Tax=Streptomyces xanthochromogenes TaxID=67384 RepID=A0ABQ2ZDI7_9ACTN|nr:hypothetical protein [Streptomyces xanthochromogenes]GGY13460.1 hypothetical protein GCM10010326_00930 [Streptomyces xanthochromogenes]
MSKKTITGPTVRPFVVAYDDEQGGRLSDLTVEFTPKPRLAYKIMQAGDRDRGGVLWARTDRPPLKGRSLKGKPIFSSMDPERQREAMHDLLCQVCSEPASRTREGWLFLDWRMPYDSPMWPEGSLTNMPPLCVTCVRVAVEQCPHARKFTAVRVRLPRLWGVSGNQYRPIEGGWEVDHSLPWLRYGDERLPMVLASQLIRELCKVTVVDLP